MQVRISGDINGDSTINIEDLILLTKAYGSKPGDLHWNQNCDLNDDRIIDVQDLHILGKNYGKNA